METIEQALLRHPLYGGSVECPALDTTAGGASDFAIFGPFQDAESIAFKNAYDAEAMSPNNSDPLKTQQTIHAKVGGLQVKFPLRFIQLDSLNA
jgi:hypothetical protein